MQYILNSINLIEITSWSITHLSCWAMTKRYRVRFPMHIPTAKPSMGGKWLCRLRQKQRPFKRLNWPNPNMIFYISNCQCAKIWRLLDSTKNECRGVAVVYLQCSACNEEAVRNNAADCKLVLARVIYLRGV